MSERVRAAARTWSRRLLVAGLLGLAFGLAASPDGAPDAERPTDGYGAWMSALHRAGLDGLYWVRHRLQEEAAAPRPSVAVVAIDEATYRTPPFAGSPRVSWTPQLAEAILAIDKAGAKVIGLDLIFPTSLDRPDLLKGHDKPFLKALYKVGRAGRLVMGETRLSAAPIRPHRAQILAVGGPKNVAPLNLLVDRDDVVRAYPASFPTEAGGRRPSFAAELVRRAGAPPPDRDFMIDLRAEAGPIQVHSLADIHGCAAAGRDDHLATAFKDRVVLIGAALDVEDRRHAANRYLPASARATSAAPCVVRPAAPSEIVHRRTTPGVFLHAAAAATALEQSQLELPGRWQGALMVAGVTVAASLIFFGLAPAFGVVALVAGLAGLVYISALSLGGGLVVPVATLGLALFLTYALTYAYRFTVEAQNKRRIQTAFRYFLAPSLVDRLAERADSLRLGGETKRVVVWFSDLAGYTGLSEGLRDDPQKLVALINRYFTEMSHVVERHGGYIDKFIGDAVMCIWGAPLDDPKADRNAVEAALDAVEALKAFNRDVIRGEFGLPDTQTRIGINSGVAVVGNMGSITRFNYTVTGDTVNLAARLEGACKVYEAPILIGEETARGIARDFLLKRLDRIVVKGASRPIRIYQPVAARSDVDAGTREATLAFRRALALYDRRRFEEAERRFEALAAADPAARLYVERCRAFQETPPPNDWDGSYTMATK